jgi:hypothetical protein
MFGIPSKEDLDKVIQDAPTNLFQGIAHALMFVPGQMKGAVLFGKGIWDSMTPEQQATVEKAIAKLIVTAAEAYVSGKAPV